MKANAQRESHTIGELAHRFDLAPHVLRHWESEGLLHPQRDASGYRRYSATDAVRVATIVHQRSLGIALPVIRTLLDGGARDRHAALSAHRDGIDAQIEALRIARDMTDHALACRAHDVAECPTFQGYVAELLAGNSAPRPLPERLAERPQRVAALGGDVASTSDATHATGEQR